MAYRLNLVLVSVLLLSATSGCMGSGDAEGNGHSTTSSSTSPQDPCSWFYYDGCDGNPDAGRMLEAFALHQMTNLSAGIYEPKIDSGVASWYASGIHGYGMEESNRARIVPPVGQEFNVPHPRGCCILYGLTPLLNIGQNDQDGDYENTTIWIWNPTTDAKQKVPIPEIGSYSTSSGGFDGRWALLLNFSVQESGNRHGMIAVNVETGQTWELFSIAPKDSTYYGTPQVGQTISNGSVFLNYLSYPTSTQADSRIVEYVLDTGEEIERLNRSNVAITVLDSSPSYLMTGVGIEGESQVLVMDRHNGTWWNIQNVPGAEAVNPVVGGDWCVYYEYGAPGSGWLGGLVGIHIPTGRRYELLPDDDDVAFVSWDTDGKYLLAQVELGYATGNATYPGTQLYWKELPGA